MSIRTRTFIILLLVLIAAGVTWSIFSAKSSGKIRNVVLISIDTCRADHLSCYGYSRRTTPNIDAVAQEGILFKHAVSPVPLTLPAHSSILTGTIPLEHKVRDNNNYQLSDSNITLAEVLRENGFCTGASVAAFVMDSQFGLDQGFDTYDDDITQQNAKFLMYNERKADEITHSANTWLKEHRDDRFFLFLHYFDPHADYNLHEQFRFTSGWGQSSQIDKYDSEIAYTDYHIGKVIDVLKELNLYDSTLLIITSDHGEGLGQHSENSHGFFIYHSTLHVPMIMRIPGGSEGKIINETVGLIDIMPTVCGVLGVDVPAHVQGKDLSSCFYETAVSRPQRDFLCESLQPTKFELGPFFGLISDRWHYIHSGKPELYDLRQDPYETQNRLAQHPQQARMMYDKIKLTLQNASLSKTKDNKIAIDEETISRLESLGYVSDRTVDESIRLDQENLDPKEFIEIYNFFDRFLMLGANNKYDEARQLAKDMLAKRPDMKRAYYFLGLLAVQENDTEAIITHLSRYLASIESDSEGVGMWAKPDYSSAMAHTLLGRALLEKGQITEAVRHYKEGLLSLPDRAAAHSDLGAAYVLLGKYELAVGHLTETLRLKPNFLEALNNLAWIYAADKDSQFHNPTEAIKLAEKACERTDFKRPDFLDTLSMAYASAGRFDEAIEIAQKAISLAESANQQELTEEIENHLRQYESSRL
jgi:arylsulfatase A-like enzyme